MKKTNLLVELNKCLSDSELHGSSDRLLDEAGSRMSEGIVQEVVPEDNPDTSDSHKNLVPWHTHFESRILNLSS